MKCLDSLMSSLNELILNGLLDKDFLDLPDTMVCHDPLASVDVSYDQYSQSMQDYLDEGPDEVLDTGPDLEYYQRTPYHWLYSSQSYGWWHFEVKDNDALEKLYRSGTVDGLLDTNGGRFKVNFEKMTQKGKNRGTRQILRVTSLTDIAFRGIAGYRIAKKDIISNMAASVASENFTSYV